MKRKPLKITGLTRNQAMDIAAALQYAILRADDEEETFDQGMLLLSPKFNRLLKLFQLKTKHLLKRKRRKRARK